MFAQQTEDTGFKYLVTDPRACYINLNGMDYT